MRKTIFGVILAVFLMLSVSFISPVTVKAAELDRKEILENINDLINSLLSEKNSLLTIIEDSETTAIVSQLMNAENEETKKDLIIQYSDLIESKYADELEILDSSSSAYINNLVDLLSDVNIEFDDESDDAIYYKITKTPNSIKVSKTESETIADNEVLFRTSDGSVKINDLGWLVELLRNLSQAFFNLLIDMLPLMEGVSKICLLVEIVALVIYALGYSAIGDFLFCILIPVVYFMAFLFYGISGLSFFFNFLANLISKGKEKTYETRLSVFKERFYKFLEKVLLFFENIKAQRTI